MINLNFKTEKNGISPSSHEEIYTLLFKDKKSVHLEKFIELPEKFKNEILDEKWRELIKIRNICNISIEQKRASKEIGSSLEAELKINVNNNLKNFTQNIDFAELCITSKANVFFNDNEEVSVITTKSDGYKCPLCWKINDKPCARSNCPKNL